MQYEICMKVLSSQKLTTPKRTPIGGVRQGRKLSGKSTKAAFLEIREGKQGDFSRGGQEGPGFYSTLQKRREIIRF